MIQVVTMEFLGVPRVIRSASCWLLVFFCAAMVLGCAEKTQQNVQVKNAPTTAPAQNAAMEKVSREFYEKTPPAPATKEETNSSTENVKNSLDKIATKKLQPISPKEVFISTAPWSLLAEPYDYPGDFSENTPTTKVKTKPVATTSAKKPRKKIVKAKSEDRIVTKASKKKVVPKIQGKQVTVNKPTKKIISALPKKFISTAPWTLIAPPSDYDAGKSSEVVGVWRSKKKKIAKQIAQKVENKPGRLERNKKSTKLKKKTLAVEITVKKPAEKKAKAVKLVIKKQVVKKQIVKKQVVKKRVKKPVVIAKKTPKDWTWPSSARLKSRSRKGKMFPATTPWAMAAPISDHTARLEMSTTTAELPSLPASSRRIFCALRVVRVSDGRVISSASAIATCGNIERLARALVGEFGRDGKIPIGVPIIAISLSNREGTDQGLLLAEKMTEHIVSALKRASKFKFLRHLDLRDIFLEEQQLELSREITAKPALKLMRNAKYLLVGGISIQQPTPVSLPQQDDLDPLASKSSIYHD